MKNIIVFLVLTCLFAACKKEDTIMESAQFAVDGYWQVTDPTYSANATVNLFHLFRQPHAYYRYSFLKTQDFTVANLRPRSDSMVSYYQVSGNQLQLPSPSPSTSNIYPGNELQSNTGNEMIFNRNVPLAWDASTGAVTKSRIDTIKYQKVTDPAIIAYFDKYLKNYHP